MDPAYLVMIGANKSRFKPTVKERYYKKYRGKGGIEPGEADDPLLSGGAGPSSSADAPAGPSISVDAPSTCLSTQNS